MRARLASLFVVLVMSSSTLALAQDHEAHGDAHHDAHAAAHHEAGWDAIDWGLLFGSVVNFGVWFALIFFNARRPLAEFLRNRRASVVEGMDEAHRIKEEAEAKFKEYSERIDNLDAELERIREEMRRAGMAERDRIVAEASHRAEKLRAEARFLIEQQMKQLREDLTREAVETAIRTAEDMLKKATTAEDQQRLAEEYLTTMRTSLRQKLEEKRS